MFARHKAGNQVHRAGPVQRVERNQIFQPRRFGVLEHALHAGAFKLKHRLRASVLKQRVSRPVFQVDVFKRKVFLPRMAADDKFTRQLQNGQRRQSQKVELDEASGFHVVLVKLADRRTAAGLLIQRAKIRQPPRRNQHAPGVHADIARQPFELARQLQQRVNVFLLALALGQNRLGFERIDQLAAAAARWRQLQRHRLTGLVRNQLGNAIAKAVRKIQHPAHVANRRPRRHRAESHDLADGIVAVFVLHVVDDAVAVGLAKVDVKVGHRDALGVQKALEQQVVFQRIEVGDFQRIRHQRACARTPARPDRAAVVFRPFDEVAHDQEVARKAHVQNRVDLELQPRHVLGPLGVALRGRRVEMG